ncbi:DNA-binding XRE family transcriptional regulator [Saccharothrix saharensis]|uniref:DNA-binding XRE family transcriptional regulator n=1 Tax=Saccharothrix saharensis TaxID=571190 RepID=A0A543J5T4_9PSEU|nr:helix-turn-helix domain-containing protein [Saccharothrix saharensis]TQM78196.1 DNA-binding XRE family transcriptional regulator [Saccharothrix saharensis]
MAKRGKLQERRTKRGFTQEGLAALLHVSPRTIRGWEAGTSAPYPEYRQPLADALDVTLDQLEQLLGEPRTSAAVRSAPGAPRYAAALVDRLHRDYQAACYDEVRRALPAVLETVAALVDDSTGDDQYRALNVQCQASVLAAKLATKIGDGIAAYEAAEQARTASETADDVFGQASAAYQLTCALLRLNAFDEAERHAVATLATLHGSDPHSLTWQGMMALIAAVIAAQRYDHSETRQRLDHAEQLAAALGHDGNIGFTAFGPTNVQIHRVSTAASADDPRLLLAQADPVDVTTLPTGLHGRQGRFHLDNAWAHTQLGDDPLAVIHLLEVERVAPQLLATEQTGRTLVGELMTREQRSKTPGLRGLAKRIGVLT